MSEVAYWMADNIPVWRSIAIFILAPIVVIGVMLFMEHFE